MKGDSFMEYEAVIGLEVHVELNTKTKIFCNCSTEFGQSPNSNVCPVCSGMPGVLPVLNQEVLNKAILAGLALNGHISTYSRFDRKQYFYPDLPKGYQISQLNFPIMEKGKVAIVDGGIEKIIQIHHMHMEEDAGKLIHSEDSSVKESYVDLNRAGVPLIEIVSEPDMHTSKEAFLYLTEIKKIMKYIGVSDVNMEEGSLRCDANISIRPKGETKLGTKAEVKNMNSFHNVEKAIDYEIKRQKRVIEAGEKVIQETRLWNPDENKSYSMRSKEESNDYRYFPEPDLVPIELSESEIEAMRESLPELPYSVKKRFLTDYKLTEDESTFLSAEKPMANFFEQTLKIFSEPKIISNWLTGAVTEYMNDKKLSLEKLNLTPEFLAELLELIKSDVISGTIGKKVLITSIESGQSPKSIVESQGLKQVSNTDELEKIVDEVLSENQDVVEKYRNGKTGVLGHLVGMVMRKTKGKANPKLCNEIFLKKL